MRNALAQLVTLASAIGLRRAYILACILTLLQGSGHRLSAEQPPAFALTTVKQVHQMTPEAAAKHLPIRLRGVVTTISPYPNAFFMQDVTAGIALEGDRSYDLRAGDEVEVTGFTGPGKFAPVVNVSNVRRLGKGKMPPAPLFNYPELTGGLEDSNWISLRGVVRTAQPKVSWGYTVLGLTVEVDGNLVEAQMMDYTANDLEHLVDSQILLRGVCTTSFNDKRQFTGIGMILPSMAYVKIEQPANPDPFSMIPTPVGSLLQFRPGARFGHRVLVKGVVTYQAVGRSLYVQDGGDGVMVETEQETPLAPGTRVAVVGFPAAGAYSPVLRHAIYRALAPGPPLSPVPVTGNAFLLKSKFVTAPYDGQLVTVRGHLIEMSEHLNDSRWLLHDGASHFVAVLRFLPGTEAPVIEPGSTVEVTGVFAVQVDELHQPTLFRVLMRSPADLKVVHAASWWSPRHVVPLLGTTVAIFFATALWGATLRRTVRQQTQMLRESEERFRNQAHHDALTGLASRSFLCEQLHEAIRKAKFSSEKLGVLMVDLDFFKQVNDTLGHHAGDELLRLVADRLRAAVRKTDIVARMGGDEFVVLLNDLKDTAEAEEIGAKVVAEISSPAQIAGHAIPISASVGVCLYPDGGVDGDALLQNVDVAMYKAKSEGRNSCSIYKEKQPRLQRESPMLAASH